MNKSLEAKRQALKDIREELKREGRTFLTVSVRQLKRSRVYTTEDIYCRYV